MAAESRLAAVWLHMWAFECWVPFSAILTDVLALTFGVIAPLCVVVFANFLRLRRLPWLLLSSRSFGWLRSQWAQGSGLVRDWHVLHQDSCVSFDIPVKHCEYNFDSLWPTASAQGSVGLQAARCLKFRSNMTQDGHLCFLTYWDISNW